MYLHLFIVTLILVAFTMLALGVKLFFDKDAEFTGHSCALEDSELNKVGSCSGCQVKELTQCSENTE